MERGGREGVCVCVRFFFCRVCGAPPPNPSGRLCLSLLYKDSFSSVVLHPFVSSLFLVYLISFVFFVSTLNDLFSLFLFVIFFSCLVCLTRASARPELTYACFSFLCLPCMLSGRGVATSGSCTRCGDDAAGVPLPCRTIPCVQASMCVCLCVCVLERRRG